MSIVAKVLPILDEGKGSAQGSRGGGGDEAGLDESRMQELRSLKPEGQGSDKAKEWFVASEGQKAGARRAYSQQGKCFFTKRAWLQQGKRPVTKLACGKGIFGQLVFGKRGWMRWGKSVFDSACLDETGQGYFWTTSAWQAWLDEPEQEP
eukprot:1063404-Pelagomonas_calceolata.AAC.1